MESEQAENPKAKALMNNNREIYFILISIYRFKLILILLNNLVKAIQTINFFS